MLYKTRIGESDVKHYTYTYFDNGRMESVIIHIATERVTAVQSISLLLSHIESAAGEALININFEMDRQNLNAAWAIGDDDTILQAALRPDLVDGARLIDSDRVFVPDDLRTSTNVEVVTGRINIADPLRRMLRSYTR